MDVLMSYYIQLFIIRSKIALCDYLKDGMAIEMVIRGQSTKFIILK